jgi:hypothetical protein
VLPRFRGLSVIAGLLATLTTTAAAQEPSLDTVLKRAAAYVAELDEKLSAIVAEESYVQQFQNQSTRASSDSTAFINRRELKSDFLLVKPPGSDRFVEFRDVFEVDSRPVRDRQERITKLFLEEGESDRARAIVEESARYNIGNIPRNINTPMLTLLFLQEDNQPRFRFRRARSNLPELSDLTFVGRGGASLFRVQTGVWVVEYRETQANTIIQGTSGGDFPAKGRFWIDPETGAVLISELVMEKGDIRAVIDVRYQSEPLFGVRVPVAMHERYRARSDRVEGIANYGKFRQFQVRTDEVIDKPDPNKPAPAVKPPPKPPPPPSAVRLRAPLSVCTSGSCPTPSSETNRRWSRSAAP